MTSDFHVVVPARYASSRLPGKPLIDIGGVPMVVRVWRRASEAGAASVIVATDDERVRRACEEAGAAVRMTRRDHASGSDRLAEVASSEGWSDEAIIVNVQADEPLLPPALIRQVVRLLETDAEADIATLAEPLENAVDYADPNVVKVVCDRRGRALYFSRARIPYHPDALPEGARRHVGLYAYRSASLATFVAAEPAPLERLERLEQLRALWLGQTIVVGDVETPPGPGVDTPRDLERVRRLIG